MKGNIQFLLLTSLWSTCFAISWDTDSPYVSTPLGGIQGAYKTSEDGRQYAAFQSVRYAKAPVGELRFEPPVPITPWVNDVNASALPPACTQYHSEEFVLTGEEDCLYLSVYVPFTTKESLPVIFWIHGGGFQYGESAGYGAKYVMDRDVILVVINYRLGPLGFLSTGDDVVPGNMGLKDQALALKWVSENIEYFGGNPKKISLMGESAGGASVQYHYLSPLSRGLFRNGVSFSGSALEIWAFIEDGTTAAKSFAASLNCTVDTSELMIQCLKGLSTDSIRNATLLLSKDVYFPIAPFPPVLEKTTKDYFINDSPRNILTNGDVYDVPWITGIVEHDGIFMTAGFILNKTLIEYTDKNWETIGPQLLCLKNKIPSDQQADVANKAREHYFGKNQPFNTSLASAETLIRLVGDGIIASGCIESAKLQAEVNTSPVRFIYYTYRAAQSTSTSLTNSTVNFGVAHDDDIYLLLENKYINPTTTEEDKAMLQDMLDYWYSIANDESPNLGEPLPLVNANPGHFQYLHIAGPKNYTLEINDDLKEIQFWNEVGVQSK